MPNGNGMFNGKTGLVGGGAVGVVGLVLIAMFQFNTGASDEQNFIQLHREIGDVQSELTEVKNELSRLRESQEQATRISRQICVNTASTDDLRRACYD